MPRCCRLFNLTLSCIKNLNVLNMLWDFHSPFDFNALCECSGEFKNELTDYSKIKKQLTTEERIGLVRVRMKQMKLMFFIGLVYWFCFFFRFSKEKTHFNPLLVSFHFILLSFSGRVSSLIHGDGVIRISYVNEWRYIHLLTTYHCVLVFNDFC